MWPWVVAALAAIGQVEAPPAQEQASPGPEAAAQEPMPFTSVRGKIVVSAAINGDGPYPFIVDAGVGRPAVDLSLGLSDSNGSTILPFLQVGALGLPNVPADAVDLSGLQRTLGVAVTGLLPARLGSGLLAIDFGRSVLSFAPEGTPLGERKHTYSTPLRPGADGPEVMLAFGPHMERARLDLTYAGDLALPEARAKEWGLLDPKVPHLEIEPVSGSSNDGRLQVRLDSVRLGGATLNRALATVRPSLDVPIVGTGFLGHFSVLFDFGAERLFLTPTGAGTPESAPVVGYGMVLSTREGDKWRVRVAVNSPAYRAGIKSGDILESVGDESAAGKSYDELAAKLAAETGKTVKLKVLHGEEPKEVTLTAEPLI